MQDIRTLNDELYDMWTRERQHPTLLELELEEKVSAAQYKEECFFWINRLEEQHKEMNMLLRCLAENHEKCSF